MRSDSLEEIQVPLGFDLQPIFIVLVGSVAGAFEISWPQSS